MRRALWSATTLLLLSHAVPAAQGTHPGPLPVPIGQDSAAGTPPAAESPPYAGAGGYGTGRGYGPDREPREGSDYGLDWGGGQAGYPPAAPGRAYAPGDYGYGPPARTGGPSAPRGYWQWVPAEPAGSEGYGYGPGMSPHAGYEDGYAPYGYATPSYESYGEGYRETYPGGGFAPPAYGGRGQPYPAVGAPRGYEPDSHYPPSGHYPDQPAGGAEGGPRLSLPAASDPPRGASTGKP
jgi:hypothetical protein